MNSFEVKPNYRFRTRVYRFGRSIKESVISMVRDTGMKYTTLWIFFFFCKPNTNTRFS